jgi:hypothetical protein
MSAHTTVGIDGLILQMQIAMATKSTLGILDNPGTGKTQIHKQLGLQWLRKHGAPESNYIYVNAATKTAEFFGMSVPIVQNGTCDFFVAEWFRRINDLGPAIICYDEFDKLGFRDQTPFLQAITERAVDNVRLHDNVIQTVLGNFRTNGNGSQGVSNIVTNRCRTVHFRPEDNRVHAYLVAIGCHPWVTSFLLGNPNRTNDFRPDRERNCTSRQWEGVSISPETRNCYDGYHHQVCDTTQDRHSRNNSQDASIKHCSRNAHRISKEVGHHERGYVYARVGNHAYTQCLEQF